MGKFQQFILNLQFIFKPRYWVMNYEYSPKWDKKLNELLDKHTFDESKDNNHTALLGTVYIWIENHPYASFMPYADTFKGKAKFRPSRLTIQRAYKQYINDTKPSGDPYDNHS